MAAHLNRSDCEGF